jgi:predicted transcriptional regulator
MNNKLLEHQKALILIHLLLAKDRRLKKAEANRKITAAAKKYLNLSVSGANQLREELVREGYLSKITEKAGRRRVESFELTERGLALLASLEQYPTFELRVKGRELNALIAAVREMRDTWQPRAAPTLPQATGDVSDLILAEFKELRREHFGHTGLVPIHGLRRRLAQKYGAETARHDVLDPQLQLLRQQNRLRLVAISQTSDATAEQLNDSIPGVNETLFYLEAVHEQPVLR